MMSNIKAGMKDHRCRFFFCLGFRLGTIKTTQQTGLFTDSIESDVTVIKMMCSQWCLCSGKCAGGVLSPWITADCGISFFRWLGSDVVGRRMWILMMDHCLAYVCINVRGSVRPSVYAPLQRVGLRFCTWRSYRIHG